MIFNRIQFNKIIITFVLYFLFFSLSSLVFSLFLYFFGGMKMATMFALIFLLFSFFYDVFVCFCDILLSFKDSSFGLGTFRKINNRCVTIFFIAKEYSTVFCCFALLTFFLFHFFGEYFYSFTLNVI